jgi:hypothetical protein
MRTIIGFGLMVLVISGCASSRYVGPGGEGIEGDPQGNQRGERKYGTVNRAAGAVLTAPVIGK